MPLHNSDFDRPLACLCNEQADVDGPCVCSDVNLRLIVDAQCKTLVDHGGVGKIRLDHLAKWQERRLRQQLDCNPMHGVRPLKKLLSAIQARPQAPAARSPSS